MALNYVFSVIICFALKYHFFPEILHSHPPHLIAKQLCQTNQLVMTGSHWNAGIPTCEKWIIPTHLGKQTVKTTATSITKNQPTGSTAPQDTIISIFFCLYKIIDLYHFQLTSIECYFSIFSQSIRCLPEHSWYRKSAFSAAQPEYRPPIWNTKQNEVDL